MTAGIRQTALLSLVFFASAPALTALKPTPLAVAGLMLGLIALSRLVRPGRWSDAAVALAVVTVFAATGAAATLAASLRVFPAQSHGHPVMPLGQIAIAVPLGLAAGAALAAYYRARLRASDRVENFFLAAQSALALGLALHKLAP